MFGGQVRWWNLYMLNLMIYIYIYYIYKLKNHG